MESIYYRIAHKAHILGHKLSIIADQALEELDISVTGYKFLHLLAKDGCTCQAKLSNFTGITPAAASKRVQALIDKGWVTTTVNPHNRRQHDLEITDTGRDLLKKAQVLLDKAASKALSHANDLESLEKEIDIILAPFMEVCK